VTKRAAFIAIMNGETASAGTPETVVVVDTRDGTIRWDLDIDLPASAVQRFGDRSNVQFVDVHGDRIDVCRVRVLGYRLRCSYHSDIRLRRELDVSPDELAGRVRSD
jgi:hypothetical protein